MRVWGLVLLTLGAVPAAGAASFAIIPQAGLAGYGAAVEWTLADNLTLQLGHTQANFSFGADSDKSHYDAKVSLRNDSVALSWAPFGGYFRVSAGVTSQDTRADLVQTSSTDPAVAACGPINIRGRLPRDLAPTLTVGWASRPREAGFGGYFAVGAMFAGAPALTARGNGTPGCALGIENERRSVENDLGNYRAMPVLQTGISYRL